MRILVKLIISSSIFMLIFFLFIGEDNSNVICEDSRFSSNVAYSGCSVRNKENTLFIPTIQILNGGMLQLIATEVDGSGLANLEEKQLIKALPFGFLNYSNEVANIKKEELDALFEDLKGKVDKLYLCKVLAENNKYREAWRDFYGVSPLGGFEGLICTKTVTEGEAIIMSIMLNKNAITNMKSWIVRGDKLQADTSSQAGFLKKMIK